jgi:uncharacterized membrane protein
VRKGEQRVGLAIGLILIISTIFIGWKLGKEGVYSLMRGLYNSVGEIGALIILTLVGIALFFLSLAGRKDKDIIKEIIKK